MLGASTEGIGAIDGALISGGVEMGSGDGIGSGVGGGTSVMNPPFVIQEEV